MLHKSYYNIGKLRCSAGGAQGLLALNLGLGLGLFGLNLSFILKVCLLGILSILLLWLLLGDVLLGGLSSLFVDRLFRVFVSVFVLLFVLFRGRGSGLAVLVETGLLAKLLGANGGLVHLLGIVDLLSSPNVGHGLVHILLGHGVLVGVEAEACHGEKVGDADHLLLIGAVVVVLPVVIVTVVPRPSVLAIVILLVAIVLELVRHGRQSHALGNVGKGVDELSALLLGMVEGASVSKLALASGHPVVAGLGLVVRMDGSERTLSEVRGQGFVLLSKLLLSMSKLAVLLEGAVAAAEVMLTHFGLVLALEGKQVILAAIHVLVELVLGVLAHHLGRWVVEIPLGVLLFSHVGVRRVVRSRGAVRILLGLSLSLLRTGLLCLGGGFSRALLLGSFFFSLHGRGGDSRDFSFSLKMLVFNLGT